MLTKAAPQTHPLEQRCCLLLQLPPELMLPQPSLKLHTAGLEHGKRNA
jgi:hypothetical protein